MSTIKLIVGLGNPGPQYIATRHNAGFWFVNNLAQSYATELKPEAKFHGLYGKTFIANQAVHLLMPQTFMNRSGQSVQAIAQFFKLLPDEILVAHDELDFDPGIVRLKLEGGHGGHNGLRDIISKLGGAKDFPRLRIGIGHPGNKSEVHNYVLKAPSKVDLAAIETAIDEAGRQIESIVTGDLAHVMNHLHQDKES